MGRSKWRFLLMFFGAIVIHLLMGTLEKEGSKPHSEWIDFVFTFAITVMVWEGNLWIDFWANRNFPWLHKPLKRIAVQFPLGMGYAAIFIYSSLLLYNRYICLLPGAAQEKFLSGSLLIGMFVSVIILTAEISSQFFNQWKLSLIQVEKYKAESLQAQLQNLKSQINPHFLFNNLSVLSSLVYKDQDKALDFINQLSKVYRYLLDTSNKELVSLEREINFIESYNYLLKIRFDANINFVIDISEKDLNLMLPPMALQMLVENTIKHNEVSAEQPLTVEIKSEEAILIVRNNFQPRRNKELSSKTGLQNIKARYKYFTERTILVKQEGDFFQVQIPLLAAS
jgi:two-component system, LytTR family, sensor kinase